MANLNSLLNKKGWTGAEVGKALIMSLVNDINNQTKPDYKPLFTQQELDKMANSLTTARERSIYGVYIELYGSIMNSFNRGQGLYQQFYNGFYRYLIVIKELENLEDNEKKEQDTPLLMTQEQYNALKKEAEEATKAHQVSYADICFTLIEHFSKEEAPPEIKQALQNTLEEPVTNKRILENYNEDMGNGYYTLADGRRSDNMSLKEWRKALDEIYLKTHTLIINGKQATADETKRHYNEQRLLKSYKLLYEGVGAIKEEYKKNTGEELKITNESEFLKVFELWINQSRLPSTLEIPLDTYNKILNIDRPTQWHTYEQPTKELTKLDVLTPLLDRYRGNCETRLLNGKTTAEVTEQQAFKEFIEDYPAVYKAIADYIADKIPQAKKLTDKQLLEPFITWGELAELDIPTYKELIEPESLNIISLILNKTPNLKRKKAVFCPIAIVDTEAVSQIDSNGTLKDEPLNLTSVYTLEDISLNIEQQSELKMYQTNLIKPALNYIYSFNALIGICASLFDIPELNDAQLKISPLIQQCEALNNMIYFYYKNLAGTAQGIAEKREKIKKYIAPISTDELKPTDEAIEKVTQELSKDGLTEATIVKLQRLDNYIKVLMGGGK